MTRGRISAIDPLMSDSDCDIPIYLKPDGVVAKHMKPGAAERILGHFEAQKKKEVMQIRL